MITLSTIMKTTLRQDDNALLRRGVSENRIFVFARFQKPRRAAGVTPVS